MQGLWVCAMGKCQFFIHGLSYLLIEIKKPHRWGEAFGIML